MKFMYSILVSCLLFIGQAQAVNLNLLDATSFDPQPVVVSAADNSVPIGTVIIWTKDVIPQGWLECNGQPISEVLYPDLAALMPTTPNYQGMFLRGAGSQIISHGGYGSTTHTAALGDVQGDTIRNITGKFYGDAELGLNPRQGAFKGLNTLEPNMRTYGCGNDDVVGSLQFNASWVVPTSTENRPVNVGVKYIIKAE